jgi:hypothetical protein
VCANCACTGPCGGQRAIAVPTATGPTRRRSAMVVPTATLIQIFTPEQLQTTPGKRERCRSSKVLKHPYIAVYRLLPDCQVLPIRSGDGPSLIATPHGQKRLDVAFEIDT